MGKGHGQVGEDDARAFRVISAAREDEKGRKLVTRLDEAVQRRTEPLLLPVTDLFGLF